LIFRGFGGIHEQRLDPKGQSSSHRVSFFLESALAAADCHFAIARIRSVFVGGCLVTIHFPMLHRESFCHSGVFVASSRAFPQRRSLLEWTQKQKGSRARTESEFNPHAQGPTFQSQNRARARTTPELNRTEGGPPGVKIDTTVGVLSAVGCLNSCQFEIPMRYVYGRRA